MLLFIFVPSLNCVLKICLNCVLKICLQQVAILLQNHFLGFFCQGTYFALLNQFVAKGNDIHTTFVSLLDLSMRVKNV